MSTIPDTLTEAEQGESPVPSGTPDSDRWELIGPDDGRDGIDRINFHALYGHGSPHRGMGLRAIAPLTGVSKSTVQRDVTKGRDGDSTRVTFGLDGKTYLPSQLVAIRQAKAGRLAAQGKSTRAIAAELGCSQSTVTRDIAALRRQAAAK